MRLRTLFPVGLLVLCELASGQPSIKPPCEYGGELLRQSQHKIKLFTSGEMKARATYKQDIFGAIKQAAIWPNKHIHDCRPRRSRPKDGLCAVAA